MFDTKIVVTEEVRDAIKREVTAALREKHEAEINELKREFAMEKKETAKNHELELKDMQFKMEREVDKKTAELKAEVVALEQKLAVSEKTVEMMDELTDLQTGMLDVKEVVNSLIKKLPNIDIKSITAGSSSKD
jgi:hypothetical protein